MSRIYRTSVLGKKIKARKEFDPSNLADVDELRYFLENKKWRVTCPFVSEGLHDDIFITCLTKYARYMLLVRN